MKNREIKFRVWDISRKEMNYPDKTLTKEERMEVFDSSGSNGYDYYMLTIGGLLLCNDGIVLDDWHEGLKLMQYSGLECNGKEIYEGDIIKWNTNGDGEGEDCFAEFEIYEKGGEIKTTPYINNTSKVAGNIYENPELLTP